MHQIASFLTLPIHPLFVHFPVALLSLTWILTVSRHVTGSVRFVPLAETLELIAVLFLPITLLSALRDANWLTLFEEAKFDQPLIWHAILGGSLAILATAHLIWRRRATRAGSASPGIDLVVMTAVFWLLVATGLLAGEMVYG